MPTLARRHFERVARDIRELREEADEGRLAGPYDAIRRMERRMEHWFIEEVPSFDFRRFRVACRPDSGRT